MAEDLVDLQTAAREFDDRLRRVRSDQWDQPTPCTDWTVRDLVNHLAVGSEMTKQLLAGATADEVISVFGQDMLGDDPAAAYHRGVEEELAAFAAPGAFEMIVHHPGAGDIPGAVFYGFRCSDHLIHAWDLARATGADETLDPDAVAVAWGRVEPIADVIPTIGVFGSGPSGDVPADAPVQVRLLDLLGRRP